MPAPGTIIDIPEGWSLKTTGDSWGVARYEAEDGSIDLAYYDLLPGVILTSILLDCSELKALNPLGSQLMTINWCTAGRCEVDFGDRGSLVVGEGTLCLSSAFAKTFSYPTGSYRGFEVFVDLGQLDTAGRSLLGSFGITETVLDNLLVSHELGANLKPEGELAEAVSAISAELAAPQPRQPWLLLGLCRLLMTLAETDLGGSSIRGVYLQRSQRDMAEQVRQELVEHGSSAAGLEAIARQLGVSTSSLRSYFSRVYGMSPAAYARTRNLETAARQLATTNCPIAEIGQEAGYSNPSKFSAAFRREFGASPLEYRRRSRL